MLNKSNETLEGYIELTTELEGNKAQLGLRLPEKLYKRFEMSCKLDGTTVSKAVRTLIEHYILESEKNRSESNNKVYEMLNADAQTQMEYLMSITPEEREYFMQLKSKSQENESKERSINKSLQK